MVTKKRQAIINQARLPFEDDREDLPEENIVDPQSIISKKYNELAGRESLKAHIPNMTEEEYYHLLSGQHKNLSNNTLIPAIQNEKRLNNPEVNEKILARLLRNRDIASQNPAAKKVANSYSDGIMTLLSEGNLPESVIQHIAKNLHNSGYGSDRHDAHSSKCIAVAVF